MIPHVLSNVSEEFVVEQHLKPAILVKIEERQFGTIPNSSTTYALISMLYSWNMQPRPQGPTQTRGFRRKQWTALSISHETAQQIKAPGDEAALGIKAQSMPTAPQIIIIINIYIAQINML